VTAPQKSAKTRSALLDATVQLMLEQGYAAVSTRKVAARAGANPALVYYYFGTMDELFLAVFRRCAEANLERLRRAAASEQPLHAVWEVSSEPLNTALTMEFMALANHREAIRAELSSYTARFRQIQTETLERALTANSVDRDAYPPTLMTMVMGGLAHILAMDGALGLTADHAQVRAHIGAFLQRWEMPQGADAGSPLADGTADPASP
jgi:AcrR family transcriptional regulator